MKNPTLLEDVGNHVSNGVRDRSCEIGKGGTLTAGSVCFLYSFVQFGFCIFDNTLGILLFVLGVALWGAVIFFVPAALIKYCWMYLFVSYDSGDREES